MITMISNGSDFHCSKERTPTVRSLTLARSCRVHAASIRQYAYMVLENRAAYRPWCGLWTDIMARGKVVFVPQTSPRNRQVLEACHLNLIYHVLFLSLWYIRFHKVLITHQKLLVQALGVGLTVPRALLWLCNRKFTRIGVRLFRCVFIEIIREAFPHYVVDLIVVLDYTYKSYSYNSYVFIFLANLT